ncbi:N-acetyltransferase family protein [Pontiella sp.]|uniref:GNAT family N-acetyltransferase n=1 Tax=Pontiella sp. TaxID=2837462 RepID=UPI00356550E2
MNIREATPDDFDALWPIIQSVAAAGETYPYPRDLAKEEGKRLWMELPQKTFLAEEDGRVLGTYYIKPNTGGGGSHVCNCGYMVATEARRRGVATALCEHSQQTARALGYKAMQFNLVISTNEVAVRLWTKLGFATVGRLPRAFAHPRLGYVDALVKFKWLADE